MGEAKFAPTVSEVSELKQRYNLTYHVPYCVRADQYLAFRGKRVLEVGGSLPAGFVRDHLGVAQWTAVEERAYWRTVDKVEHLTDSPLQQIADARLVDATPGLLERDYVLLDGAIEDAPETLAGQFDAAFSIACFEHVSKMPQALERIAGMLRPGGRLFTMFSPIWSAHDGHHLPEITDRSGRTHKFDRSPIPPWGHLLVGPSGMYQYLRGCTDDTAAAEMVYYIYHAPHINRLFAEDYVAYFQQSSLEVEVCNCTFPIDIPAQMQAELERRHPDKSLFRYNGILAVLRKRPA